MEFWIDKIASQTQQILSETQSTGSEGISTTVSWDTHELFSELQKYQKRMGGLAPTWRDRAGDVFSAGSEFKVDAPDKSESPLEADTDARVKAHRREEPPFRDVIDEAELADINEDLSLTPEGLMAKYGTLPRLSFDVDSDTSEDKNK
jgi:hypothetical protein